MVQILHLDSRSRLPLSTVSNASFLLPRPLSKVRKLKVKSVQFINTFNNISTNNNRISTNLGEITIPPKYYTAQILVLDEINNQLQLLECGSVSLDDRTNKLSWNLNTLVVINTNLSTMNDILGLRHNTLYTSSFETQLFLATPQYISFSCDRLIGSDLSNIFPESKDEFGFQPFITIPVSSGYLQSQTHEPLYERTITLDSGRNGIDIPMLTIKVYDNHTRREINEITHWAMTLEFF